VISATGDAIFNVAIRLLALKPGQGAARARFRRSFRQRFRVGMRSVLAEIGVHVAQAVP
jgi:hypothetical protein